MKTILDSIIDNAYYVIIYDFVYKVKILNKNDNIYHTVQVCILEADKGPNNYEKGSIINVPPETEIYSTKELAIKETLNTVQWELHYLEKEHLKLKQELEIIENRLNHFKDVKKNYGSL